MGALKLTACMKVVSKMGDMDQDALLERLDRYAADGVPVQRAQIMAASDTLAELQDERKEFMGMLREQHPDLFRVENNDPLDDQDIKFSKRKKPDPEKTVKAYKLFRVYERKPGKLFPLFVDQNTPVPVGVWLDADVGEQAAATKTGKPQVKSKLGPLAFRPGWHAGDVPIATHIGGEPANRMDNESGKIKKLPTIRKPDEVWAEVEMAADQDWQAEADRRATPYKNSNPETGAVKGQPNPATAAITDGVPVDGFYRYKTNPNMTGNWLIGGSMKVNRILSDAEVKRINKQAGVEDLPRKAPFDSKKYGFDVKRSAPRFLEDIPNEDWLQGKIDYARQAPRSKYGVPKMGSITGYFKGNVMVPVRWAKDLPGENGEQSDVRQGALEGIRKTMRETGKLPLTDSGDEYAPYIEIGYDGKPWVSEGNHRIMAAAAEGWDYIPAEVRYFDGGQRRAGKWAPENLLDITERQSETKSSTKRDVTDTPEFKRWFGDSKVVDADGKPLVVYHGTTRSFSEFKKTKSIRTNFNTPQKHLGHFFTDDAKYADQYTSYWSDGESFKDGANTIPVYISLKNPKYEPISKIDEIEDRWTMQQAAIYKRTLIAEGYDGIIFGGDTPAQGALREFVAFSPTQIKSAIGNNGQFDGANPDIRKSTKRDVTDTPEFRKWFGDSMAVDGDGNPLVVYHGTPTGGFYVFDATKQGSKGGRARGGFSFTTDRKAAQSYADSFSEETNTIDEFVLNANKIWDKAVDRGLSDSAIASVGGDVDDRYVEWDWQAYDDLDHLKESADYGADVLEKEGMSDLADQMRSAGFKKFQGVPEVKEVYLNVPEGSPVFKATKETLGRVVAGLDVRNLPTRAAIVELDDGEKIFYVADPTQIKSATDNNGQFDASNPDIRKSTKRNELGLYSALESGIESMQTKQALAGAWKSQIKGLVNKGIVKADELEWSGLNEWLDLKAEPQKVYESGYGLIEEHKDDSGKWVQVDDLGNYFRTEAEAKAAITKEMQSSAEKFGKDNDTEGRVSVKRIEGDQLFFDKTVTPKISKEEILDFLKNNGVKVQEVRLGGGSTAESKASAYSEAMYEKYDAEARAKDLSINDLMTDEEHAEMDRLQSAWDDEIENYRSATAGKTKYDQYTLPGGENYREVLLTLPESRHSATPKGEVVEDGKDKEYPFAIMVDGKEVNRSKTGGEVAQSILQEELERVAGKVKRDAQYKSSHWDQPNVLAHIRLNDRTDAEGNKVLFVEELQSDFQQDYRKSKEAIAKAVEADFQSIVDRMKKAGVLEVECD